MIEVKNLRKVYGQLVAVDNISFSVKRGEVLGILGPNGAGKSTTIRMITGFLTPNFGEIFIDRKEETMVSRKKIFEDRPVSLGKNFLCLVQMLLVQHPRERR
ncbi:MAG: ATP-binding cassette domain-containing protein [Oligoflexia bacterium]|nr:ATP-binding cassette domain-containing protein [Oligoflexia bacterium]